MEPVIWWRWAAVLVPGTFLYFFPLLGLNAQQSRLFGVFVATFIALVAQPVRLGVSVVIAMTLLALTGTLAPAKVLSGFANLTVWLIFTAFLFARAVTVTGFGTRVGYLFVRRFARTPLRLGYSMAAADLVLAPFVPSDTARGVHPEDLEDADDDTRESSFGGAAGSHDLGLHSTGKRRLR